MKNVKMEYKILLAFALLAFVTIASAVGLTQYLYQTFYVDRLIESLSSHGHELASTYDENKERFLEKIEWSNESLDWEIIFTENPMLLSGNLPFDIEMDEHLISFEERQTLLAGDDVVLIREHEKFKQDILAVVIPLIEEKQLNGVIFLYTPLSAVYEPFRPLWTTLILSSLALLTIMLFAARKITNHIVKPLKQMTRVTQHFASGNFSERLSISQNDEFGQLASSFNAMASSLQQVEQNRREFLANVSHELRTPISYMKGFSEGVAEGLIDYEQYISIMQKETSRLERLVNDLLDLAQLEGDSYPMESSPLPFAQLILDVIERFELKCKEKDIILVHKLDEEIIIYGDADRLEQVVMNVLQNAYQYSSKGQQIEILLFEQEEKAILQIKDEGEGIPEDDLPNIMDRFYRVNKARTRNDGGTGIGLAIVNQIVKKHDGDISIESELGKGTKVTVELPVYGE
ncbi:sensor histidine kinase [Pueribacillus sp. YX66]|uniref:sensor histidine kinase n=1 Tax=Pueribacillus sp. YX66 TaxID=3229242 RepID=UPI00358D89C6